MDKLDVYRNLCQLLECWRQMPWSELVGRLGQPPLVQHLQTATGEFLIEIACEWVLPDRRAIRIQGVAYGPNVWRSERLEEHLLINAPPCQITGTYGLPSLVDCDSDRESTVHSFPSADALFAHLRDTRLRFADHLAELKQRYPDHELNTLGPEYLGVACGFELRNPFGQFLSVATAPEHWMLVVEDRGDLPPGDADPNGRLVCFLGDWTEWSAQGTYQPQTARSLLLRWLTQGNFAQSSRSGQP